MALMIRQTLAGQAWVAQPNRALSPAQTRTLLLAAAGISGGIATGFAIAGAWPVLPFAGIEIGALWAALHHLRRHADDEESLELTERQVILTRNIAGHRERHEFIRYWTRLRIDRPPDPGDGRLYLRSHGCEVEIGRLLTDAQKQDLAVELRAQLGTTKDR